MLDRAFHRILVISPMEIRHPLRYKTELR